MMQITPDKHNANRGTKKGRELVAKSIKNLGAGRSIVVDKDGQIIAGNKTYEAAQAEGLPVRVVETDGSELVVVQRKDLDLDDPTGKARQLAYADNRAGELGLDWDLDVLKEDIELGLDLGELGLDIEKDIDSDADKMPDESEVETRCKLGDVWRLGKHRLLCGSCEDLHNIVTDGTASLLITDPPYGVSYADKNAFLNKLDGGKRNQTDIIDDGNKPDEMFELWKTWFASVRALLKPGAAYYVTGPQRGDFFLLFQQALRQTDYQLRHTLIWAKNNHVLGRSDYHYKHEPILYGWVDGAAHHAVANRSETSLWEIPKPQNSKEHPTMKPVELYVRAMRNSTDKGDIVIEPFAGSGTGIIAAEELGRVCLASELSPQYCDVILKRWEDLTGKKAVKSR